MQPIMIVLDPMTLPSAAPIGSMTRPVNGSGSGVGTGAGAGGIGTNKMCTSSPTTRSNQLDAMTTQTAPGAPASAASVGGFGAAALQAATLASSSSASRFRPLLR